MAQTADQHPVNEAYSPQPRAADKETLKRTIRDHLIHRVGKDPLGATQRDWLHAVSYAVRDLMIERRMYTSRHFFQEQVKRVYYLSMEFLLGRTLTNALLNMGAYDACVEALGELDVDYCAIAELEPDAALGNGGLGRLAACILDSLATQCYPGYGYGIRYEYGMFQQQIEHGEQVEHPDAWLAMGNPWEFPRPEKLYPVGFYGRVVEHRAPDGSIRHSWEDRDEVLAMAYDYPIPGYHNKNVNNLRLWAATATRDFDLNYFNEGDYIRAVEAKNESEHISRVLYPNDATAIGKELRLKQEYFFVAASLQDIIQRHLQHHPIDKLHEQVAIQLNDTHPAIAVPELMRVLLDEHGLGWDQAWHITQHTFGYTNHTLMPEALETWPVPLMERVLPRHLQVIYDMNHLFLKEVRHRYPAERDLPERVSLIDEAHGRHVRMAHVAVLGSHRINGVAELHTRLLKETLFADFYRLMPERFVNVTNGITPRLWLNQANPGLRELISSHIGRDWVIDFHRMEDLVSLTDNDTCRREFRDVKRANKAELSRLVEQRTGVRLSPDALFDIQVKRIHEYKRQLLNLLHVITLYRRIRDGEADDRVPRAVIFGGKAAPSYIMAKRIIRLINAVADVINHDPLVGDALKLVFFPNYEVSAATALIPAADLSQQISTAGTEASGTGNMKLALNGALTIGTLDGANIEIREEVGEENIFIFGMTSEEVSALRRSGYHPRAYYDSDPELRAAIDMIASGYFSPEAPDRHRPIVDSLLHHDPFMVLADYASYIRTQEQVDAVYRDPDAWSRKAMINTARMGKFSIDRTVSEYAQRIWDVSSECFI